MTLSLFLTTSPFGSFGTFILPIAMFAIFYFVLFLPMQRQKKQTQQMLQNLKKGDTVVTSGGLVGTIVDLNAEDGTLVVKVKPDNVRLQISRSAVSSLASPPSTAS